MKRILAVIMAALVLASLAACGNGSQAETTEAGSAAQERKESEESASAAGAENAAAEADAGAEASSETASEETDFARDDTPSHSDVLVAYFSATGTTKGVAERIAVIT